MPAATPGIKFLENGSIVVNDVRLSYPSLWRPRKSNMVRDDGTIKDAEFEATSILKMDTHRPVIASLRNAILKFASDKWSTKDKPYVLPADKMCLRDGRGSGKPEIEGAWYFRASEKIAPKVFGLDKVPLAEADGKPYGGCYVNVMISLWASDHPKGGRRVLANLLAVQFNRDGEPFSRRGQVDIDEGFESYEEADSVSGGDGLEDDGLGF